MPKTPLVFKFLFQCYASVVQRAKPILVSLHVHKRGDTLVKVGHTYWLTKDSKSTQVTSMISLNIVYYELNFVLSVHSC
jgi:hypothetical protein